MVCQTLQSLGFYRQEYLNELPVPSQKCVYVKSKFLTCPSCLPLNMFSLHVVFVPLSKKKERETCEEKGEKEGWGKEKTGNSKRTRMERRKREKS